LIIIRQEVNLTATNQVSGRLTQCVPGPVFTYIKPMDYKHFKLNFVRRAGFSLAELMVSIALISVISVAVSLAMYQSRYRTGMVRNSLAEMQKINDGLKIINDDLRWASDVQLAASSRIEFTTSENPGDVISIYWNSETGNLYRSCNGINPIVILDQVANFTMEYDLISRKGVNYIRGLTIIIASPANESSNVRKYIYLLNQPRAL